MMDFTMSIASMAMDMKAAQFAQDYAVSLTSKVMDTQEQLAANEIREMMPQAPQVPEIQIPKGEFIDVYA